MRYQPQNGKRRLSRYALSLGFTHAWNFGDGTPTPVNAVTGRASLTAVVGPVVIGGVGGKAVQFDGNADHAIQVVGNPFNVPACTYLWTDSGIDATSSGQAVTMTKWAGSTSGESGSLQIRIEGSSIHVIAALAIDQFSVSGRDNTGKLNTCAVSVSASSGATYKAYANGAKLGQSSGGNDGQYGFGYGTNAIGTASDCPSSSIVYYQLLFAPKVIAEADLTYLTANPWAVWENGEGDYDDAVSTAPDTSLSGAVTALASANGTLSTSIRLTAGAAAAASAAGTLSTSIRLTVNSVAVASASGSLTTSIPLSGAASAQASASGSLVTSIALTGSAGASATASGTLAGGGAQLSGAAVASASATGGLTTQISLSGSMQAVASASGTLAGGAAQLAGAAVASASASGQLTTQIKLTGSAVAIATASGTFAGAGAQLSGAASASASAAGVLTTAIALAGAAIAQASASATLAGQGAALSGAASASASATGVLTTGISLAGIAHAVASGQAALSTQIALVGIARAQATAAAQFAPTKPPTQRVLVVNAQSRVLSIAPQNRVYVVDA